MERRVGRRVPIVAAVGAAAALAVGLATPWEGADAHGGGHHHGGDDRGKLLFFASDGLRQDAVEEFSDDGVTPGFRELLRRGAYASDHGLLTQAPPNTGAGWFTLATGAWPGVHGSTNNTFHINNTAYDPLSPNNTGSRRSRRARAPACCRPRRSRSRPSAAARRSRRSSGRAGAAARSTARPSTTAASSPAAAWPRTTSRRPTAATFTQSFRLQFDHPAGFAGNAPFPQAAPTRRDGLDRRAALLLAREGDAPARPGRHARDKYGLNAYLYDSRNDRKTKYDRVLFSRTKSGADKVADLAEGDPFADVKVKIVGGTSEGKTGVVPGQGRAALART